MSDYLRPGSIRIYASGTPAERGSRISVTNYPFQGLDIATEDYEPWFWLAKAENAATFYRVAGLPVSRWARAGECKHQGETWRSPFGTPLAEIARTGGESTLARDGWSQAYDAWQPWESMEGYSVD